MVTKIITGKMVAAEHKLASHRDLIRTTFDKISTHMAVDIEMHINDIDTGNFVQALVDFGRWGARCECGGAEYVDPDDPVFYCFSCGNLSAGGKLRPVQFPSDWKDIELLLLERPIEVHRGITASSKALQSKPLLNVNREWKPGKSVADVQAENAAHGLEGNLGLLRAKAAQQKSPKKGGPK